MSDSKFDKRDLDMVLDCIDDLRYERCKEAISSQYQRGNRSTAESVHSLISYYDCKKEYYIELYINTNPNQKDYFHCPRCKKILNTNLDWKFKDEYKLGHCTFVGGEPGNHEEVFYCLNCGWTGEKAPFEEVKEGGNQAE